MPTLPRMMLLAAVAVSAVMIGGCGATPPPEPSPSPSASPVFASEEEALAAATEAYAAYLETSDLITSEGGIDPERIQPFVSSDLKDVEASGFEDLRSMGGRTTGRSTFDSLRIQQLPSPTDAKSVMTVYVCADVSEVRLLNADGLDVTPPDRPNRLPFEVDFLAPEGSDDFLVHRNELWTGDNFC